MKTKLHYYLILAVALAFSTPKANAQAIIQFWDFNATPPSGGAGGDSLGNVTNPLVANRVVNGLTAGHIIYSRPNKMYGGLPVGICDNGAGPPTCYFYDYSNTSDSAGGNLFLRSRNPADSAEFYVYIPTTGFKNIQIEYAVSNSSNGAAQYNILSYSTNSGTSWNNLTRAMDTFNVSGAITPDTLVMTNATETAGWYPVKINLTSDANVNNNANFIFRIRIGGSNSTASSHNDRYDDFTVLGNSIAGAGIDEMSALEAGYDMYPNPAHSNVNITSTNYTGDKIITIYNVVGQTVSVTENHSLETSINTSSLNAGIYFVEIREVSTGNRYTEKLVKE